MVLRWKFFVATKNIRTNTGKKGRVQKLMLCGKISKWVRTVTNNLHHLPFQTHDGKWNQNEIRHSPSSERREHGSVYSTTPLNWKEAGPHEFNYESLEIAANVIHTAKIPFAWTDELKQMSTTVPGLQKITPSSTFILQFLDMAQQGQ